MEHKPAKAILGWLWVIVLITACSSPGGSPTAEATDPTASAPGESAATEQPLPTYDPPATIENIPSPEPGVCDNAYYPVREGSQWSYQSTGSPAGAYSFTDTITDLEADGFTLTSQFDGLTRTQAWACRPEGLVALQFGGGALTSQNLALQVETENASGVTYPTEIAAGDQWEYALDFTGTMDIAGNAGAAQGNVRNDFQALGVESVTVPAGTFSAMKIQVDTTLDISVSFQGINVPVAFSGSYTYWFVEGVGWVKAEGSGDMGGQAFTETIVVQWFNIP